MTRKKPGPPSPCYPSRGSREDVLPLPLASRREECGHTALPVVKLRLGVLAAIAAERTQRI
jgi:hypothetical protein